MMQLLCTFTDIEGYITDIDNIIQYYDVCYNKLFVLQSMINQSDIFLTYNVNKSNNKDFYNNTISVHRKKESNTIYTINSLNAVIKYKCGELDKSYKINWMEFQNCILLTNNYGFKKVPTKLFEIVEI